LDARVHRVYALSSCGEVTNTRESMRHELPLLADFLAHDARRGNASAPPYIVVAPLVALVYNYTTDVFRDAHRDASIFGPFHWLYSEAWLRAYLAPYNVAVAMHPPAGVLFKGAMSYEYHLERRNDTPGVPHAYYRPQYATYLKVGGGEIQGAVKMCPRTDTLLQRDTYVRSTARFGGMSVHCMRKCTDTCRRLPCLPFGYPPPSDALAALARMAVQNLHARVRPRPGRGQRIVWHFRRHDDICQERARPPWMCGPAATLRIDDLLACALSQAGLDADLSDRPVYLIAPPVVLASAWLAPGLARLRGRGVRVLWKSMLFDRPDAQARLAALYDQQAAVMSFEIAREAGDIFVGYSGSTFSRELEHMYRDRGLPVVFYDCPTCEACLRAS
jgi:hypothetical protein